MDNTAPHITQLRQELLGALRDLRNREAPMEPDRARAIATVAGVIVDSARVEVEYLRATGQERAGFLQSPDDPNATPSAAGGKITRAPGVVRHRLEG